MGIFSWLGYLAYYLPLAAMESLAELPGNIATGVSDAFRKNKTKFIWNSAVCAPAQYPMEILSETGFYRDEQFFYIQPGQTDNGNWGNGRTTYVHDNKLKFLPNRLKIEFLSYTEKQYYQGEFDLPYERMEELFRDGVKNGMVSRDGQVFPNYRTVMVGIAPGGVVAVWAGGRRQTEVFFGQAEKVNCDTGPAFDENVENELVGTLSPEQLQSLKQDGIPFGLWARYRQRYDWLPVFHGGHNPDGIDISYLNGEIISNWVLTDKKELNNPRPVPRKMLFDTPSTGGEIFEVEFDQFETMSAFEKLGANGKKVYMEIEPHMPKTQIKIRLYNDTESIVLKKFESKP